MITDVYGEYFISFFNLTTQKSYKLDDAYKLDSDIILLLSNNKGENATIVLDSDFRDVLEDLTDTTIGYKEWIMQKI